MLNSHTEIVYWESRLLEQSRLPGGIGRKTLDTIAELVPLGRGWTFYSAVYYSVVGVGRVPVVMPDFIDGKKAHFVWGGGRARALKYAIGSALMMADYVEHDPTLVDKLWAEGHYRLLARIGAKFPRISGNTKG